MWSSLWKQQVEDVCIILDIGNGSIGGSMVRFNEGDKPEIIYSVRYPIHVPDRPTSKHLLERMTKLLDDVMTNLAHDGARHLDFLKIRGKDIQHIFCIFSTPWYASKSKNVRVEKKEPTLVTEELIRDFLSRERKALLEAARGSGAGSVEFIEQKVIRAKLNGYEMKQPYNQLARHMEFGLFISMVPSQVIDKVEGIISKHFNARFVAYHSFALMSYNIIEDLFPGEDNYMFMDITSEVTELAFVNKKNITDTLSFPHGRNLLMRTVAKEYKVTPDIASSYVKMYQSGAAGKELKRGIEESIAETKKTWTHFFARVLVEISKEHPVPSKIFVTIDDDVAAIFSGFLSGAAADFKGIHFVPNVTVLNKNILAHFCVFGRGSQEDAFLAIESVYFNKIFHL